MNIIEVAYLLWTWIWWAAGVICGCIAKFLSWWVQGAFFVGQDDISESKEQYGEERRARDRNSKLFWIEDDTSSDSFDREEMTFSEELPILYDHPEPVKGSRFKQPPFTANAHVYHGHFNDLSPIVKATIERESIFAQRRARQKNCVWYNKVDRCNSHRTLRKGFLPAAASGKSTSHNSKKHSLIKKRWRDNEGLLSLVDSLDSVYKDLLPSDDHRKELTKNTLEPKKKKHALKIQHAGPLSRASLAKFLSHLQSTLQILVLFKAIEESVCMAIVCRVSSSYSINLMYIKIIF